MTSPPPRSIHVVAAVVRRQGRLLLCQRPEHKHHGGLWEFPGGKVEPGESPEQALGRELGEELGLALVSSGGLLFRDHEPSRPLTLDFLEAEVSGEPTCHEHQALAWVTAEEALSLPLAPADRRFVERLLERGSMEKP